MVVMVPVNLDLLPDEDKMGLLTALFDSLEEDVRACRFASAIEADLLGRITSMRDQPDGGAAWYEFRSEFAQRRDKQQAAVAGPGIGVERDDTEDAQCQHAS